MVGFLSEVAAGLTGVQSLVTGCSEMPRYNLGLRECLHFLVQLDNFLLSEINDAEDDSEHISVDNEAKVEVRLV